MKDFVVLWGNENIFGFNFNFFILIGILVRGLKRRVLYLKINLVYFFEFRGIC